MRDYVIIVAGGTGSRMQHALPKQFIELHGEPILVHTLRAFHAYNPQLGIVVTMHPDYIQYWNELCGILQVNLPHSVAVGGKERFHSVRAGLELIEEEDGIVGIHDAVRPLVSSHTLHRCYETARETGAAVPVIPIVESLRQITGASSVAMSRSMFRMVQTPQCFRIATLRKAMRQEFREEFTDDASVVESAGEMIHLVDGNRENIKITTPEDLAIAEALMQFIS